jgi:H/ACA ribonucleoprotein complex non-core subunit NAF1
MKKTTLTTSIGSNSLHSGFDCSDSSDSDEDILSQIIKTAQVGSLEGLEDDGDDCDGDEGAVTKQGGMRTKNEVVEEINPVNLMDISISETTHIELLGTIEKVLDSIAIVKAHTDGEYQILDEGAFVFTETRKVVGTVSPSSRVFLISRYRKPLVR